MSLPAGLPNSLTVTPAENEVAPKPSGSRPWWLRLAIRLLTLIAVGFIIGTILNRVSDTLSKNPKPAGFVRGMVQGALMPMAMPNLLFGRDITIYSNQNSGVPYKLGYTAGVNVAGIVCFGFFFWRISRWRKNS